MRKMSEQRYERDPIKVVAEIREEQYMRGYKDGYMRGKEIGAKEGIRKGINEIEHFYHKK